MKNPDRSQNPHQQSGDHAKDAQDRLERRRRALRRKSKRAVRGVVRVAEDIALKGGSRLLRVVRKLNRPIRRRIKLDD